jgi:hypothetical protein
MILNDYLLSQSQAPKGPGSIPLVSCVVDEAHTIQDKVSNSFSYIYLQSCLYVDY